MKHSLTNKDTAALTGDCSVCGTGVSIVKVGNGHGCRTAVRAARRNYKKAHPDRARAGRALNPSTHRLSVRTGAVDNCVVCGEVKPVAWGRGWMCPTIIKEKGWTVTQTAPAPKCKLCNKQWLVDGACPACDSISEDMADMYIPAESRRAPRVTLASMYEEAGFSIVAGDAALPTEIESAVAGWKTLGSTDPVVKNGAGFTVRPEYAALYGSGSR